MKKFSAYFILPIVLVLNLLTSCGGGREKPDVSQINFPLDFYHFERQLRDLDTNRIETVLPEIKTKLGGFLDLYVNSLLPFRIANDSLDKESRLVQTFTQFLTDKDIRGLLDTVNKHFPDTKTIDKEIGDALILAKYYYPKYTIHDVVYFISGLNNWTAVTYIDSTNNEYYLGIGLDMYLGKNYPYYLSVGIPQYMTEKLVSDAIPVNAMKAVFQDITPFVPEDKNLLQMMIERGKEQIFLQAVLPDKPQHELFGFTKRQLEWCEKNEAEVYNFFIKQDLLYETNWQKILRYVNDGPNSTGMPAESPGNIGTWLGYRILEAYKKEHKGVKIPELISMKDAQSVLQESKYKPR